MITIHVSGGLGNQLFQYAAGRALSIKNDERLLIDRRVYISRENERTFELENYTINAIITPSAFFDHLKYKLITTKTKSIFSEKSVRYDLKLAAQPRGAYLLGHWQSEKYFRKFSSIIKKDLTYKYKLNPYYQFLLKKINNSNSVFLHVRRGDYISNSTYNQVHGICSNDYYTNGLKLIEKIVKNPHIFIFSDDIKWAKSNLHTNLQTTFVNPKQENACHELEIMRACKHSIIANSSFSWWGAWLDEYGGKIIIAPNKWFNSSTHDATDIVPDRWVKI